MPKPVFGTAHLFGQIDESTSRTLLDGAAKAGFRSIDTAPSYGHGTAEPAVGRMTGGAVPGWTVSTKVGIGPVPVPSTGVRAAKFLARRLPTQWQERLRGQRPPGGGQFEPDRVAASIRRSVDRLGRIDRLLLHEVHPDDITPELLAVLESALRRGEVAALGLATSNALTSGCLSVAPGVFTVVHLAVGIRSELPAVPAGIIVVGHGVMGVGGADLNELAGRLQRQDGWSDRWQAATRGTPWSGRAGLADALVRRACARHTPSDAVTDIQAVPVGEVIVASSRPERVERLRHMIDDGQELTDDLAGLLDEIPPDRCAATGAHRHRARVSWRAYRRAASREPRS